METRVLTQNSKKYEKMWSTGPMRPCTPRFPHIFYYFEPERPTFHLYETL